MRTINETFTDEEHEALVKIKGDRTWREFIVAVSKVKIKEVED